MIAIKMSVEYYWQLKVDEGEDAINDDHIMEEGFSPRFYSATVGWSKHSIFDDDFKTEVLVTEELWREFCSTVVDRKDRWSSTSLIQEDDMKIGWASIKFYSTRGEWQKRSILGGDQRS